MSTDNRVTLAGASNGNIYVVDTASGEIIYTQERAHRNTVRKLKFNKDNTLVISGGYDFSVHLWRFDGRRLEHLQHYPHTKKIGMVDIRPRDNMVLTGCYDAI